ncbi:MAG TPA: RNA polymerase sigma factor region1.1 domain-containing protein, partial [Candidatus Acidoferrum sp.]|nr:RNA polymerase sigma factor region1.1 domain-containing protein [Candidatus Acidoferrum sp.]
MAKTKTKTSVTKSASRKASPSKASKSAGRAQGKEAKSATATPATKTAPASDADSSNGEVQLQALGPIKSQSGVDLTEKVKELVRLAQEQGYLTYGDINDALPDNVVSA